MLLLPGQCVVIQRGGLHLGISRAYRGKVLGWWGRVQQMHGARLGAQYTNSKQNGRPRETDDIQEGEQSPKYQV